MTAAFVMMQINPDSTIADLHKALHAVAGIKTVHLLAGPTDMIAFVEVADQAALMDALMKIRAVKGVASTDTRMVLPM